MTNLAQSIANTHMLASVEVRLWQANVKDKSISAEVAANKNAEAADVRVYKSIAKHPKAVAATSAHNNVRNLLYKLCPMPFGSERNAGRLIALSEWLVQGDENIVKRLEAAVAAADASVGDLLDHYDEVKQFAAQRLQGAFDINDFPSAAEISNKFHVNLRFEPIASSSVLENSAIPASLVNELGEQLEAQHASKLSHAMAALQQDLIKEVDRVAENFAAFSTFAPAEGKRAPKLYDSLLSNMENLVRVLRANNVTGNQEVKDLTDALESKLTGYKLDDIRDSNSKAAQLAAHAKTLADKVRRADFSGKGAPAPVPAPAAKPAPVAKPAPKVEAAPEPEVNPWPEPAPEPKADISDGIDDMLAEMF